MWVLLAAAWRKHYVNENGVLQQTARTKRRALLNHRRNMASDVGQANDFGRTFDDLKRDQDTG